jgi:hypothetical protein
MLSLMACAGENDLARSEHDDLPSRHFPFRMAATFEPPPGGGFWGPVDITTTGGKVWVLDHKANRIYTYDSLGGYLATLSQEGHGPGELFGAMAIGVARDTLWVFNTGNRRIDYWDGGGGFLGTQPLPDGAASAIDMIAVGDDFVAATAMGASPLVRFQRSLGAVVPATSFGGELSVEEGELRARHAGGEAVAIPSIYRLELVGDRIWAFHLYLPLVGIFTYDGRLVRLLSFPSDPIEAGGIRAREEGGQAQEIHSAPANPGGTLGVLRGAEGEVYLLTHQETAGRQRLYVVDAEGKLLGRTAAHIDGVLAFAAARDRDRYVAAIVGELEEPAILRLIVDRAAR